MGLVSPIFVRYICIVLLHWGPLVQCSALVRTNGAHQGVIVQLVAPLIEIHNAWNKSLSLETSGLYI